LKGVEEEKGPFPAEGEDQESVNWTIKEYGDVQLFNPFGKEEVQSCYGTIAIKN